MELPTNAGALWIVCVTREKQALPAPQNPAFSFMLAVPAGLSAESDQLTALHLKLTIGDGETPSVHVDSREVRQSVCAFKRF